MLCIEEDVLREAASYKDDEIAGWYMDAIYKIAQEKADAYISLGTVRNMIKEAGYVLPEREE